MRQYIRVDPGLADRKCHYPDGALAAFALTLCFAEHQPQRGRFKPSVLKALLERRARWIPFLIEHYDLEKDSDGRLYLVGWDEWQEGDWKVSERMQRVRARRETVTPTVTPGVTQTVTATVTPLSDSGRRLAVSGKQQAVGGRQGDGVKPQLTWPVDNTRRHGGITPLANSLPVVRR